MDKPVVIKEIERSKGKAERGELVILIEWRLKESLPLMCLIIILKLFTLVIYFCL